MEKWFPIETERLLLREFRAADEADIHEYASDAEVSRLMDWGPNTSEVTKAVVERWIEQQKQWPRRSVELAIEVKGEKKVIGGIRLEVKDERNRTADFGYALNRQYWNRGYASEATKALLHAAFGRLNIHRVWATCDARNHASYRVMEKLGMRREACFAKDVLQRGEWRDSYLYAVLAEEWTAQGEGGRRVPQK
jgi:ribosomal-protein-alanine N-acetyltransferase